MILSELASYLCREQRAALRDLSLRFDTDAGALRGMLSILERKGRVRKLPEGTLCSTGCHKCDTASLEIYEWVGARDDERDRPATRIQPNPR